MVIFQTEDGIAHEEFNTYSHLQAKDGRLYFGGLNGITAFYPRDVVPEVNDAPFLVTSLQQFDANDGKLVNKLNEFQSSQKIQLNPGDKFFNIEFSLLDYSKRKHTYAWKIEGLDNEWSFQKNNNLRLYALPYGKFQLKIKAKSAGGKWAKQVLNIPIKVIRPFYHKWPFILSVIGLSSFLVFYFIRWRTKWLEKEKEKLEKIVEERTYELGAKNKELEAINRTKDRFFAIIAHDPAHPINCT